MECLGGAEEWHLGGCRMLGAFIMIGSSRGLLGGTGERLTRASYGVVTTISRGVSHTQGLPASRLPGGR